ncbi:hypothetical protein DFJ73DRAFT_965399 [Zopfochytrium polystomum]|nr:hypothetical protein DFJ73DRAFT_965399 [Zopfochytrium polystomum]
MDVISSSVEKWWSRGTTANGTTQGATADALRDRPKEPPAPSFITAPTTTTTTLPPSTAAAGASPPPPAIAPAAVDALLLLLLDESAAGATDAATAAAATTTIEPWTATGLGDAFAEFHYATGEARSYLPKRGGGVGGGGGGGGAAVAVGGGGAAAGGRGGGRLQLADVAKRVLVERGEGVVDAGPAVLSHGEARRLGARAVGPPAEDGSGGGATSGASFAKTATAAAAAAAPSRRLEGVAVKIVTPGSPPKDRKRRADAGVGAEAGGGGDGGPARQVLTRSRMGPAPFAAEDEQEQELRSRRAASNQAGVRPTIAGTASSQNPGQKPSTTTAGPGASTAAGVEAGVPAAVATPDSDLITQWRQQKLVATLTMKELRKLFPPLHPYQQLPPYRREHGSVRRKAAAARSGAIFLVDGKWTAEESPGWTVKKKLGREDERGMGQYFHPLLTSTGVAKESTDRLPILPGGRRTDTTTSRSPYAAPTATSSRPKPAASCSSIGGGGGGGPAQDRRSVSFPNLAGKSAAAAVDAQSAAVGAPTDPHRMDAIALSLSASLSLMKALPAQSGGDPRWRKPCGGGKVGAAAGMGLAVDGRQAGKGGGAGCRGGAHAAGTGAGVDGKLLASELWKVYRNERGRRL